jgi:ankyrin repeat protein/DNA replication protein DnaC
MKSENHINSSNQSVLNILYDNRISAKTILEHKDLLSDLARGQTAHGANLEKLRNHDVWSIRTNRKGRILYTYRNIKGIKHILVLEILDNHEYDKSKFLQKQVLAYHLEKNKEALDKVTEKDFEQTKIPVIIDSEFKNASFSLKPAYENNGTYIVLDEVQETSLSAKTPMVIEGPPGSGKTSLAEILLKQAVENKKCVLYVTQSFLLADKIKSAWMASAEYVAGKADVMAYDALLQDLQVDGKKIFEIWFSTSIKEIVKDKNAAARFVKEIEKVFEEFRIISGYSKQEYTTKEGIGQKQCLYKEVKDRELLYSIYEAWKAHLAANNIKLSEFYDFRKELKGKYDLVIVDESQDLSHIQLYNLSRLCKKLNIIYCIDPRQNLQDENPKLIYLKQMLTNKGHQQPTLVQLLTHYRCPKRIMDFALVFNQLRIQLAPKNKAESKIADTDNMEGQLEWIDPKDSKGLAKLKILSTDANACVVTQKEFITEVREKLGITQVFTPDNVKGLEYKTVVLYKILNTNTLREVNKVLEQTTGKEDEMYSAALSGCFVASTRATESLYVVQNEDRVNHIVKKLKDKITIQSQEMPKLDENHKSTHDEWVARAKILVQSDNVDQARIILRKHLDLIDEIVITNLLNQWDPRLKSSSDTQHENVNENATSAVQSKSSTRKRKSKRKKKVVPQGTLSVTSGVLKENNSLKSSTALKQTGALRQDNALQRTITLQDFAAIKRFFDALYSGDIETCRVLLSEHRKLANANGQGGISPLHYAVKTGNFEMVKVLLKAAADPSSVDEQLRTPLHIALTFNYTKIVYELLGAGADPNPLPVKGITALDYAISRGNMDAAIMLLNAGAISTQYIFNKATELFIAAATGHTEKLISLIDQDVDVHCSDTNGTTPLHLAAQYGNDAAVKALLKAGANPNQLRTDKNSALHLAAWNGHLNVVKALLGVGADLNLQNDDGETPLHLAVEYENNDIAEHLIFDDRIYLDIKNNDGKTAVDIASFKQNSFLFGFTQILNTCTNFENLDLANNKSAAILPMFNHLITQQPREEETDDIESQLKIQNVSRAIKEPRAR